MSGPGAVVKDLAADTRPVALVAETARCRPDDVAEVGGKAVGLGSLLRAGMEVPPSFVVTAAAYRRWVAEASAGTRAGATVEWAGSISADLRQAIAEAYARLCAPAGADLTVAVRSSATIEDSSEASCAGQFRTYLGATGAAEVVAEVERCWISAFDPHVETYRSARDLGAGGDDGVAVVVQVLVDARAAGVMFTQHPRTGDRSLTVIEASYGLGEAVVGGEITPDLFEVNKITGQIQQRSLGAKPLEHRLATDRRSVERVPVDADRRQAWSISDDEVAGLVAMGGELEARLGRGLDVEWAIGTTAAAASRSSRSRSAPSRSAVRPVSGRPRSAMARST